jgi:hypothetical protein
MTPRWLAKLKSLFGITKYQIRTLSVDVISATADIPSLRLSNLTIGQVYRLTMNLLAVNGDATAQLTAVHNGTPMLRVQQKTTAVNSEDRTSAATSIIFVALASTVTFDYAENDPAGSQLDGNGTTLETFVMLEELANHTVTTQWT